ncbi:GNAT family N-acetyltransferase [Stigmatella sp. ncwal1]|uniref:GNAT family N-acetyltransferase n=1 Tax=Stigmatella ashevillensis TaxID=2995309 RepID=A0ABT5D2M9_9BACT|nr:GNAT family N-acetyltransferase [Stigmatella ashevillena]MDC0707920.1 GNAT family N-acetyltransferase [Stigmatella ashevillena]
MSEIEILPSIHAIPRTEWDAMAPADDPLWCWSFFEAMETTRIGLDGFAYLALKRDGQRVAILPVFWIKALQLDDVSGKSWPIVQKIRRWRPEFLCISTLICGNPLADGRLLVAPGAQGIEPKPLLQAVRKLARSKRLRWIFFKDFGAKELAKLFPHSIQPPFFEVEAMPDAVLDLPWDDFEGYLAHLSPKTRWSARSRLRKVHEAPGVRIEVLEDFAHLIPQMFPLYRQVYEHADARMDVLTPGFFAAVAADRELRPTLIACWKDDQLIGFLLCVFSGGECTSLRIGLDYPHLENLPVYFVLFAESIRLALARGCHAVNFTQTSYIAKLRMGSHLRTFAHAVTHTNPVTRLLARRFLPRTMGRYRDWEEVHAHLAQHAEASATVQ